MDSHVLGISLSRDRSKDHDLPTIALLFFYLVLLDFAVVKVHNVYDNPRLSVSLKVSVRNYCDLIRGAPTKHEVGLG